MALRPIPGYGMPPKGASYLSYGGLTPSGVPKKGNVPRTPQGDVPWYLTTPAADMPGYIAPGAPGYTTPTGTMYTGYPTFDAAKDALGGGGGGGGGKGPLTYQQALEGDPLWQQATNAFNTSKSSGRRSLVDSIRSAMIAAGYDIRNKLTGSLADYANDFTDADALAATQNPLSGRAQLQEARDVGRSDLGYRLASRGVLRSGELDVGNTRLEKQFDIGTTGQMNDLLNVIRGGVGGYDQALGTAADRYQQAQEAVASRLSQQPGSPLAGGVPDPTVPAATPPPSTAPAGAVKWGGQTWTSWPALSRYLQQHGEKPALWLAQHRDAPAVKAMGW